MIQDLHKSPGWRYETLLSGDKLAAELVRKDPLVLQLAVCLAQHSKNDLVKHEVADTLRELSTEWKTAKANEQLLLAIKNFSKPFTKRFFEAFLLTRATDAQIAEALLCQTEVVTLYRHLFFDLDVFKSEIDCLEYVESFTGPESEPEDKSIRLEGLRGGFYHMSVKYGSTQRKQNPQDALKFHLQELEHVLHERRGNLSAKDYTSISQNIIKLLQVQIENPEKDTSSDQKLRIVLSLDKVAGAKMPVDDSTAAEIRANLVGTQAK